jgi:lipopolysaccharide export system protein LptA
MKFSPIHIAIFLSLICSQRSAAQDPVRKPVKLIHANDIFFDKSVADAQRLIGDVQLLYEGTVFRCDSAYLYSNQNFDAFGNIRVNKGSSYTMTGGALFFQKDRQLVRVTRDVVLHDGDMTLYADQLNYDLSAEVARYTTGGRIVSDANRNVLTSRQGTYDARSQIFYFRDDVVLVNPEYRVESDTLRYHEIREIAYFFGPTTITSETRQIYCENGWYDTRSEICQFNENAEVISEKTVLRGDSIYYDGKKGYGEVFRNVSIRDTTTSFLITGGYGRHTESSRTSLVTRSARLIQAEGEDSLFMAADTLLMVPDSSDRQFIRAFHHVKIYRIDLQGLADSLTYSESDSTLSLFSSPVLWSEGNQITGDTIHVRTWKGRIDRMRVRSNSFIISEALKYDTAYAGERRFNQIRGRNLISYFRENEIYKVHILGNGELVYFAVEEKPGREARIIGHNRGECSDISVSVEKNQIRRIALEREPDSVFTPIRLATDVIFELDGFSWRGAQRPTRQDFD